MEAVNFVESLKKLEGAISYDGNASTQVLFYLANGRVLRIGVTDEDVGDRAGLWADQYLFEETICGDPGERAKEECRAKPE